jgi:hypothetical protein
MPSWRAGQVGWAAVRLLSRAETLRLLVNEASSSQSSIEPLAFQTGEAAKRSFGLRPSKLPVVLVGVQMCHGGGQAGVGFGAAAAEGLEVALGGSAGMGVEDAGETD